jgi:hypothetical protein
LHKDRRAAFRLSWNSAPQNPGPRRLTAEPPRGPILAIAVSCPAWPWPLLASALGPVISGKRRRTCLCVAPVTPIGFGHFQQNRLGPGPARVAPTAAGALSLLDHAPIEGRFLAAAPRSLALAPYAGKHSTRIAGSLSGAHSGVHAFWSEYILARRLNGSGSQCTRHVAREATAR